jgi:hypothetical protein
LKKSGTGDQRWGIRVAMTNNLNLVTGAAITNAGGGGTAYYNSFNWSTDEVALVFNKGEYAGAETVSHEVGHTLNLRHDGGSYGSDPNYYEGHGSGATSWGTIMGAPFINADENVTQWSKGEYIGANNTEDDLAIITTGNGFSYRVDDYGNTLASAFALTGTNITTFGIIERTTDIDWFKFDTGAGNISFNINNASRVYIANGDGTYTTEYLTPRGPNLDISAKLFDASGTLLAQNNPADLLTASLNYTIATAGTYYLSIDGVGVGTPLANPPSGFTEYASLGQYSITGAVVQPVVNPAILVSPTSGLTTTEAGGTASFTVVLATQPTANVTIGVSSSNANEGTVNINSLTFTTANWNVAQTVSITGVDDALMDGNSTYSIILASAVSSDTGYNGLDATDVSVVNADNDFPSVSISSSPQTIIEGLTSNQVVTYTVTLNAAGTQPLTVQYATSNGTASSGSDYTSTSGTLTFNPNVTSQTITIPILNDAVSEADETFTLTLSNPTNGTLGSTTSVVTTITDTLAASSTTTLPSGVENLTLTDGTDANGTGNTGNNLLRGNSANNTLKGGGGLDSLTGGFGKDQFDLSGISTSANRNTITDWIVGDDTVLLSDSLTTRSGKGTPTTATVSQATSVTLNTSNTNSIDLFLFNFDNTETGVDLGVSTNGTMLLDGLSNNSRTDTASLNASASRAQGYILAYDNGNGYLYSFNSGGNKAISSSEIALIGIFDSQSNLAFGSLTGSNFTLI